MEDKVKINVNCTLQFLTNKTIFDIKEVECNLKKYVIKEYGTEFYILADTAKIHNCRVVDID